MSTTINGKKKVTEPKVGPSFEGISFGASQLDLPKGLRDQLSAFGYDVRFINSHQLSSMGGYHQNGWKPFKTSDFLSEGKCVIQLDPYLMGNSPDGTIQKKEMILAIRPKEMTAEHKKHLAQKVARQSGDATKKAAAELRRISKEHNLNVDITEGYDDN